MSRGFKFKEYCKNMVISHLKIAGGPNYKLSKKCYT